MKRKLFAITLLCLSICLLIVGCNAPSPDIPNTDVPNDSNNPAEPVDSDESIDTPSGTDTSDTEDSESVADTEDFESSTEPIEPKPISMIGNVKNKNKVKEDLEIGTITLKQMRTDTAPPSFSFFHEGEELTDIAWGVTGTINIKTTNSKAGHIVFIANRDSANIANIFISRRVNGSNGIWRNITRNGVRTPASATTNENISNTFVDATDWTGDFAFLYYEGRISLYVKVGEGEFELMTYYDTDWQECTAEFAVNQFADATFQRRISRRT